MLKLTYRIFLSVVLIGTVSLNVYAANDQCISIAGMGLADAIDETHLVAALSGDMTGARAEITGQKQTETGLILDMEHYFINDKGGLLKTKDKAALTAVPGKDQVYMLEIVYNVVDSQGTYASYQGKFNSYGLINLGEGKVILRYTGELCK